MHFFRNLKIQHKLTLLGMITTTVALVLAVCAFGYYEMRLFKESTVADLTSFADILAVNCNAGLEFKDQQDVAEVLDSLKSESTIVTAAVYDNNGQIFSTYSRSDIVRPFKPPTLKNVGAYSIDKFLVVFRPIFLQNNRIGTIYLQTDLTPMYERFRRYTYLAFLVFLVASTVAFLLSFTLQRVIARPIIELAETARQFASGKDYSIRAKKWGDDEIGVLTDQFNLMLATVAERDQELDQARQAAEEKAQELARSNKELEQFAYAASHDLQEPLRTIKSYLELLQRSYGDKLDAAAHEYIGFAVGGATRMAQLVKALLDYSRVGTKSHSFVTLDLEEVLAGVIQNLDKIIEETKVTITHDPLPVVVADEFLMTQLFQNLIANAIKYRGKESPIINISGKKKAKEWEFSVQDNGIGFDPRFNERIFIIFQRLHTQSEYPGTGVGLAICQKIIEQHKGRIWAESELGQGATFHFTLPFRVALQQQQLRKESAS